MVQSIELLQRFSEVCEEKLGLKPVAHFSRDNILNTNRLVVTLRDRPIFDETKHILESTHGDPYLEMVLNFIMTLISDKLETLDV